MNSWQMSFKQTQYSEWILRWKVNGTWLKFVELCRGLKNVLVITHLKQIIKYLFNIRPASCRYFYGAFICDIFWRSEGFLLYVPQVISQHFPIRIWLNIYLHSYLSSDTWQMVMKFTTSLVRKAVFPSDNNDFASTHHERTCKWS